MIILLIHIFTYPSKNVAWSCHDYGWTLTSPQRARPQEGNIASLMGMMMIDRDKPWDKPWDKGCDWGVAPTFRETHTETPCSSCNVTCGNESSDCRPCRLNENKRVQVCSSWICDLRISPGWFRNVKARFHFCVKGSVRTWYEIIRKHTSTFLCPPWLPYTFSGSLRWKRLLETQTKHQDIKLSTVGQSKTE